MINMSDLLLMMVQKRASDLHITSGTAPVLRIDGHIVPTPFEKLTPDVCQRLIYSLLTDQQRQQFEAKNELDLSFGIKGVGRVRMNVFRQRGSVGAALRSIPSSFMTFEELGLPEVIYEVLKSPRGLFLVTGPTGSGKSTTLASMIDHLNETRDGHIITVEDPIEYIHQHKKCIVNQREIGQDTAGFGQALKYILRQDPDIILIGEMRDLETMSAAITIAETGHLVFATLHTNDAPSSINRIIDAFPLVKFPPAQSRPHTTRRHVLVVDRSGSMYGDMTGLQSTLIKLLAVEELRRPDVLLSLVSYSSTGDVTEHFRDVRADGIGLREIDEINRLRPTGLTCMSGGLRAALGILNTSPIGTEAVVTLHSDGYANDASPMGERRAILDTILPPFSDMPTGEDIQAQVEKFLNPPVEAIATATAPADTESR
jgi:pilus retraction protein PilT